MARERAWARNYSAGTENSMDTSALPRRSDPPASDAADGSSAPPTFSLTIGNVCFDLVPDAAMVESGFGSILYEACGNSSYGFKLDRFSGTLKVRTIISSFTAAATSMKSPLASTTEVTPKTGSASAAASQINQKRPWQEDSDDDSSYASNLLSPLGVDTARESIKRSRRFSHSSIALEEDVVEEAQEQETSAKSNADSAIEGTSFTQQSCFLGQPDLSQTVSHTSTNHGQELSNNSSSAGNVIIENPDDSNPEMNDSSKPSDGPVMAEEDKTDEPAPAQSKEPNSPVVHDIEKLESEPRPARVSIGSPVKVNTPNQTKSEQVSPTSSVSPARSTGGLSFGGDMAPSSRWGHTLTDVGDEKWIVYGGQNIHCSEDGEMTVKTLNDFYIYQSQQNRWIRPINYESALPRQWHTSNFLKDQNLLVVFGGECFKNGKSRTNNQVMLLDTEIMVWYPPSVSGSVPSGRSGHSATLLRPPPPPTSSTTNMCAFLIVFGGVGSSGRHQNSIACLDTDRWIWFQPKCEGLPPQPRSYHTATAISATKMIVFGGNGDEQSFDSVHILEVATLDEIAPATETEGNGSKGKKKKSKKGKNAATEVPSQYKHHKFTWSSPLTNGPKPAPRTGHSAVLLDDKKTLCIHGGWDPTADDEDEQGQDNEETKTFGDTFFLDTETWTWTKGGSLIGRTGHKAILHLDNKVHVFGGRGANGQFLGDLKEVPMHESQPTEA